MKDYGGGASTQRVRTGKDAVCERFPHTCLAFKTHRKEIPSSSTDETNRGGLLLESEGSVEASARCVLLPDS